MRRAVLVVLLLGCAPDGRKRKADADTGTCDLQRVGWDAFADGYLRTWCTPCHASTVVGDARGGAPVGMDFDSWAGAAGWADRIAAVAADASMPPAGGPTAVERARIRAWVDCGSPGFADAPDPCAYAQPHEGDLRVDADFDAVAFCATPRHVGGDLVLAADTVGPLESCVCGVDGDLIVEPGALDVSLLALTDVGGCVSVARGGAIRVVAPALGAVGGDLEVVDNGALEELHLPALASLGGPLTVTDNAALETLALPELGAAASITVTGNAALGAIAISRLAHVDGDLIVDANASLRELLGTEVLLAIEGGLHVRDNPMLRTLDKFTRLERVGGDLEILRNAALTSTHGFYALTVVDGRVSIRSNPALASVKGFMALRRARSLAVVDNATLRVITGFGELTELDDYLHLNDDPDLRTLIGFGALTRVGGDLQVLRDPVLAAIDGLRDLREVDGDLRIGNVDALSRIDGLTLLRDVGGELVLEDAPALGALDGLRSLTDLGGLRVQGAGVMDLAGFAGVRRVSHDLVLLNNDRLRTVGDLADLRSVGGDLEIRFNPRLPPVDVDALLAGWDDVVAGEVRVGDNADP